jgi:hypothetical protein
MVLGAKSGSSQVKSMKKHGKLKQGDTNGALLMHALTGE